MASSLLSTLGVVCPACDHYNAPEARRCASCGADLDSDSTAPKVAEVASERAAAASSAHGARHEVRPPGMKLAAPTPKPQSPASHAPPKWGITILAGQAPGQRFRLGGSGCLIGRIRGAVLFPEDPYVSPVHAALIVKDERLFIRDDGSVSGVFVSISAQATLAPSDSFAVGNRLFRYLGPLDPVPIQLDQPGIYGAPVPTGQLLFGLEEVLAGARPGRSVVTTGPVFTIGQKACDWEIPDDPDVSPRHCELNPSRNQTVLRDLSGPKGTFVRIRPGTEHPLGSGDRVRIGTQMLKVDSIA